ncbi:MAG: FixH family protein [Mariprofundales bacterium]
MLSAQVKQDLKNPWLRGILAVVAVTVAVNICFITYAFISPPNLVVRDYYERGQNYFHDAHQRQEGAATAWRLQLLLPNRLTVNSLQTCRLYVMDHEGKPVNSGHVTMTAYRPSDAEHDFKLEMKRVDVGTFAASFAFPLPGSWDLIARIASNGQQFDTAQRVFVQK